MTCAIGTLPAAFASGSTVFGSFGVTLAQIRDLRKRHAQRFFPLSIPHLRASGALTWGKRPRFKVGPLAEPVVCCRWHSPAERIRNEPRSHGRARRSRTPRSL